MGRGRRVCGVLYLRKLIALLGGLRVLLGR